MAFCLSYHATMNKPLKPRRRPGKMMTADQVKKCQLRGMASAVKAYGSQAALARAMDCAQPTINQWVHGVFKIPPERATQIEELTAGSENPITRAQLRPDVFGGM